LGLTNVIRLIGEIGTVLSGGKGQHPPSKEAASMDLEDLKQALLALSVVAQVKFFGIP
jgi:hypothetical protein